MTGQLSVCLPGVIRSDQLHQFNLLKLVLSNHATGVLSVTTCLTAKTGSVADIPEGQSIFFDNLVPGDIGDRHFRRGNQIELVLSRYLELILGKFGQLTGAEQGFCFDQVRYIDLLVAVLPGVYIQHELGQGTLQARNLAVQDDKSGTGQFRRGFKVHAPVQSTQIDVVLGHEVEVPGISPAVDFDIVSVTVSRRDRLVGQVRNGQQFLVQLLLDGIQLLLALRQLRAHIVDVIQQRLDILPCTLGLADHLRSGVTLRQHFFSTCLDFFAGTFQGLDVSHIQLDVSDLETFCYCVEFGSN